MRRKLIQIGKSTLLLSAPREWVKQNSLSKGDEVEVDADNDKLTIWCDSRAKKEKLSIDATEFRNMLPRLLYSVYRSGVDELELRSRDPEFLGSVKSIVWKEALGFELIEQKEGFCRIVNVSGKVEDFGNILRRLFMINLTMADEAVLSIRKNAGIENILYMEQENNRLAAMLLRSINKYGSFGFRKIGPLYYIVQELERIADSYKFISQRLVKKNRNASLKPASISLLADSGTVFRQVYELFYSFNPDRAEKIKSLRNRVIREITEQYAKKPSGDDIVVLNNALSIAARSFDMVTSIIILNF
ncbi:phosphate uptake regulator PhoU [Candidatus Woesearchaeota archaeon]|nr:phosphate uptake regulator PhoU [Candidatus Woesearchaeota archaeon]